MLRLPVGAGLLVAALGAMAGTAIPVAAAERALPAGVTIIATPQEVAVGSNLKVTGSKFPPGTCATGRVLLIKTGTTTPQFQLGSDQLMDGREWEAFGTQYRDVSLGTIVPFTPGTYNLKIFCLYDNAAKMDLYDVGTTVTIVAAPVTTTTTVAATTTSSSTSTSTTMASTTTTAAATDVTKGTVEPSSAKPATTKLTLRGGGFGPNQQLKIALNSTPMSLGTTNSNGDGLYATTLTLPANAAPGDHTLAVTGTDPAGQARTTSAALSVQDLGCSDFANQTAAQQAMGPDGADPHGLDPDKDGQACATGGVAVSAGRAATNAGGSLPRTGTGHGSRAAMAALCALAFGALFIGLSHPEVPVAASHRRMRTWRRSRSSGAARAPAEPES